MSRLAVMYPDPDHASACAENENVRSIASLRQDKIEAGYFDDAERGINQEWAQYDIDASAESLIATWGILEGREESVEKVALIREIIRKLMRSAAESHAEQVMSRAEDESPWDRAMDDGERRADYQREEQKWESA